MTLNDLVELNKTVVDRKKNCFEDCRVVAYNKCELDTRSQQQD